MICYKKQEMSVTKKAAVAESCPFLFTATTIFIFTALTNLFYNSHVQ